MSQDFASHALAWSQELLSTGLVLQEPINPRAQWLHIEQGISRQRSRSHTASPSWFGGGCAPRSHSSLYHPLCQALRLGGRERVHPEVLRVPPAPVLQAKGAQATPNLERRRCGPLIRRSRSNGNVSDHPSGPPSQTPQRFQKARGVSHLSSLPVVPARCSGPAAG